MKKFLVVLCLLMSASISHAQSQMAAWQVWANPTNIAFTTNTQLQLVLEDINYAATNYVRDSVTSLYEYVTNADSNLQTQINANSNAAANTFQTLYDMTNYWTAETSRTSLTHSSSGLLSRVDYSNYVDYGFSATTVSTGYQQFITSAQEDTWVAVTNYEAEYDTRDLFDPVAGTFTLGRTGTYYVSAFLTAHYVYSNLISDQTTMLYENSPGSPVKLPNGQQVSSILTSESRGLRDIAMWAQGGWDRMARGVVFYHSNLTNVYGLCHRHEQINDKMAFNGGGLDVWRISPWKR